MSTAQQRSALAALDAARPIVARLDASRDPEDAAADLIDGWSAVETALRSLVGGSALGGQALVTELRQRQLLNLDETHALIEFNAARERAQRTDYRPTSADVASAREGFLKLEAGLMSASRGGAGAAAAPVAPVAAGYGAAGADAADVGYVPRRRNPLGLVLGLLGLVVVALALWWFLGRGGGDDSALARGVALLEGGRREAARGEFSKAARDDPNSARPHIFLARMAREERDFTTARRELDAAIRKEPENPVAHREMGALLFTMGNYDLARAFYIRALRGDPSDRSAMGYLGCSLSRMGRAQEGATWIQRAGQGPWSNCLMAPAPAAAPRRS